MLVLGLYKLLRRRRYTVYVDSIHDPTLSRAKVDRDTCRDPTISNGVEQELAANDPYAGCVVRSFLADIKRYGYAGKGASGMH